MKYLNYLKIQLVAVERDQVRAILKDVLKLLSQLKEDGYIHLFQLLHYI